MDIFCAVVFTIVFGMVLNLFFCLVGLALRFEPLEWPVWTFLPTFIVIGILTWKL